MGALVGAFLVALLVVGAAGLSGHPLPMIAMAVAVGSAILGVMWRLRALSAPRSTDAADRQRR